MGLSTPSRKSPIGGRPFSSSGDLINLLDYRTREGYH